MQGEAKEWSKRSRGWRKIARVGSRGKGGGKKKLTFLHVLVVAAAS